MSEEDPAVDAQSLTETQMNRLLALTETAIGEDRLSATDATELFELLETAGVDLETADRDRGTLEARLTDATKIARLLLAIERNAARELTRSGLRTGSRLLDTALTSETPKEFLGETTHIARDELERLGIDLPLHDELEAATADGTPPDVDELRRRGDRLFERSADVDYEESVHPAFARIVDELAVDEVRILRLLAEEGPQPVVTVRDKGYLPIGSELVAADLSMLCVDAGCRDDDRQGAYLTNLHRLGLVWIADDPVADLKRYQVLEAQPHVESAIESATRAGLVRRSLHLTPLGTDFCETVLSIDLGTDHAAGGVDQAGEPVDESGR